MKVPLKHIFSILLQLLVAVAVLGQNPDEPVRAEKDTLVTADSVKVDMDTVKVRMDTVKIYMDTLMAPIDTTKVNVLQDTLIAPIDSVLILPDTIRVPLDSAQIPRDTTITVPPDTVQMKSDTLILTEATIKEPRKSIKQPKDTIIGPSGFEVFIDYGKLVTIPSDFETKAEGGVSYTFREKLQILVEIGYGKISPQEAIKNGSYTSEGFYARGGLAYGGEILPKNFLYIGFMYGTSRFEDSGTIQIESQVFEDLNESFSRTDLEATWIEFVIISETEIKNNLFLGSKWRLRNLNNFLYDYVPIVYAIPGYGRSFDNSIPAINLYIKYRIGF